MIIEEAKSLDALREMGGMDILLALGAKAKIYDPYILLRSLEICKGLGHITTPTQIRELIEALYKTHEDEPVGWQELRDLGLKKAKKLQQKALRNSNIWTIALKDEEGAQTRINEVPRVNVALCRVVGPTSATFIDGTEAPLKDGEFLIDTARAIHKNLVKVPRYCFDKVEEFPGCELYRSVQTVGLVLDNGAILVSGLSDKFRLQWSPEYGVEIIPRKIPGAGV